ncbi:MAG: type 4a pilus biogenesis protein PilO, partial [Candidatus Omnitrophica bacterium]|nr:type 4a pilus biogenesis protein PilO [Candidatus Omnitrophota bacterium]
MLRKGKSTKREVILFVVFLAIYAAVSMDKLIEKAYNSFHKLQEEIVLTEKNLFYLKSVSNNAGQINAEYDAIFAQQPAIRDSDKLMQEINNIARRQRVNIINIKPSLVNDEERRKEFSIKIESQDDIATLARFISALTEEKKNIGIERVQVKAQGQEELPRISLWLNASTFK